MEAMMPRSPIPDYVSEFLAEPNPAVIATLRSDGSPHCVPTWYDWLDGDVMLNMDRSRKRLNYLRRDGRVALTVMDSTDWYSHVALIGEVIDVRDDPDLADIDRLAMRYNGRPYANRARDSVTAIFLPTRWATWGARFARL
jgi:PPOX class probable F420-dependent enzyme